MLIGKREKSFSGGCKFNDQEYEQIDTLQNQGSIKSSVNIVKREGRKGGMNTKKTIKIGEDKILTFCIKLTVTNKFFDQCLSA